MLQDRSLVRVNAIAATTFMKQHKIAVQDASASQLHFYSNFAPRLSYFPYLHAPRDLSISNGFTKNFKHLANLKSLTSKATRIHTLWMKSS